MRICHDHQNRGTSPKLSAQRLGAEILVLRRAGSPLRRGFRRMGCRLIRDPKFRFPHGQLGDHRSTLVLDAEQYASSERDLVELDRLRPVSNREHWGYEYLLVLGVRLVTNGGFLSR